MKTLINLVLTLLSVNAFAAYPEMRSIDCDRGVDPHGGKYCVYEVSQCINPSCEEAVKCMVKKVHGYFAGEQVSVHIAKSQVSQEVRDGEPRTRFPVQSHKDGCNGRQCLTPMIVYTRIRTADFGYKAGQCEPTALLLVGDQSVRE